MKKVIYILLLSLMTSLTITACTEENVEPKSENGGGVGSERNS